MSQDRSASAGVASAVMMIRPTRFRANPETRASNAFQRPDEGHDPEVLTARARAEVDAFAAALAAAGVEVFVLEDATGGASPDAVFPNNWVSFHDDGRIVVYPMEAPSRRREVRPDLLDRLERRVGRRWPRLVDLTHLADEGTFLEGTGSLVLDRPRRVAFAARSARTTERGCRAFANALGYEVRILSAHDDDGRAIYHTNVLLALGPRFAVVCLEALDEPAERDALSAHLRTTGRETIAISFDELRSFCGNLLALRASTGEPLIALSDRARAGLRPEARRRLEAHGRLISTDLTTIETHGGGGARCMLAEVFPPPA